MQNDHLPIISLFCGAGGLDWGFRRERFRIILACDNSVAAINSYNLNTKARVARPVDLSVANPKEIIALMSETTPGMMPTGVIGGPPCQGFSRGNASGDPNDVRNLLPFKYAELLAFLNSKYSLTFFVFENVLGLKNPRHIDRFRAIKKEFEGAGFNIFCQDLNASSFGVPQNRPRLFLIGLNSKLFPGVTFVFPRGQGRRRSVRDVIDGLPAPAFFTRGMTTKDIPYHPNHWTMTPKSPKLLAETSTDGRSFRWLHWDEESPTIAYGNREIHVHPDGGRRLSVHEAMLLQGFPPQYRLWGNFSQQITQVSNVVPPPVARALARAIRAVVLASRNRQRPGSSWNERVQP
ncbi:MAG: DNA cytosine methyltransferase [Isosphaeraceae bacterium]